MAPPTRVPSTRTASRKRAPDRPIGIRVSKPDRAIWRVKGAECDTASRTPEVPFGVTCLPAPADVLGAVLCAVTTSVVANGLLPRTAAPRRDEYEGGQAVVTWVALIR